MELKPSQPPGHANRKLRGLVSEIARLRTEGYTIQGIQQALSEAGIEVGWTTVQREVARSTRSHSDASRGRQPAATSARPVEAVATGQSVEAERPQAVPSRADVDTYFDKFNTNPLLNRNKGKA